MSLRELYREFISGEIQRIAYTGEGLDALAGTDAERLAAFKLWAAEESARAADELASLPGRQTTVTDRKGELDSAATLTRLP